MAITSFSTPLTPITTSSQFTLCKNMKEVKQSHAQIAKQGLTALPHLISSCAQLATPESLEYAKKAYELYERDLTSAVSLYILKSLIKGYSVAGMFDAALLIYAQTTGKGLTPDNFTFQLLLSGCAKARLLRTGIQLHGSVLKLGLEEDLNVRNSLIHFYAEFSKIGTAKKLFDKMSERDVRSWNSLICGCAWKGKPEVAVSLFFEMVEEADIKPNSITVVGAISACAKLRDLDLGERVSAYISKIGIEVNTFVMNALVDMYMKCGAIDRGKELFEEFVDKNSVSYTILLSNYVRHGMEREALAVLVEMLRQGLQPDRVTMISAASAISNLGDFAFARQLHCYAMRKGLDDWETVGNSLINRYARCGKQELARRVFDRISTKSVVSSNCLIAAYTKNGDVDGAWELFNEMTKTDVVTWNIMIGALLRRRSFDDAIQLFREMQNEGVKANKLTLLNIASVCGYLGDLDLAKWFYRWIQNQGFQRELRDSTLNKALADMLSRCGDSESTKRVFDRVGNIDISAWNRVLEILDEVPKRSSDQKDTSSKLRMTTGHPL